jgi:hypothetical protein
MGIGQAGNTTELRNIKKANPLNSKERHTAKHCLLIIFGQLLHKNNH